MKRRKKNLHLEIIKKISFILRGPFVYFFFLNNKDACEFLRYSSAISHEHVHEDVAIKFLCVCLEKKLLQKKGITVKIFNTFEKYEQYFPMTITQKIQFFYLSFN